MKNNNGTNFWISYADLMAGLLFVFILLIGAIVAKTTLLKTNLDSTQNELLKNKKDLTNIKTILLLKEKEIKKLKKIISNQKDKNKKLYSELLILQNNILALKKNIKLNLEIQKKLKDKIIILSDELSKKDALVQSKNLQINSLLEKLEQSNQNYLLLTQKLEETKKRIKNLTGMKVKIINILKEALGDRVKLDKDGSLKISSNILFDKGKSTLKDDAKKELEDIFTRYIKTLVVDPRIRPYLDKIIIEGHTDSDGGYLYNLNLSQNRAYSVMNFLLSLDFAKKYDIKKYILASGRSFLDPVLDKNGKEDKNASRRIEIKFLLKNNEAMKEIEKILEEN